MTRFVRAPGVDLPERGFRVPPEGALYARAPTSSDASAVNTTAFTVDDVKFLRAINVGTPCTRSCSTINASALLFNHVPFGWTLNA
jgi:hypothetical protein